VVKGEWWLYGGISIECSVDADVVKCMGFVGCLSGGEGERREFVAE
jgi:hypothetical protein